VQAAANVPRISRRAGACGRRDDHIQIGIDRRPMADQPGSGMPDGIHRWVGEGLGDPPLAAGAAAQ